MLNNFKTILWDFDGVLMDSNAVRELGFERVLAKYPKEQVDKLILFHRANGGLSRYVKFRYFFEQILKEQVSDERIQNLAKSFSEIMRSLLVNPDLLIPDSLNFIKSNYNNILMHVVSGSDENELRHLCGILQIDQYFKTINGSPTPKKELVRFILQDSSLKKEEVILIGDSINDYDAAKDNGITFIGYNNPELKNICSNYIPAFSPLNLIKTI